MKFTLEDARKFGWEGWGGWAYSSKEDFSSASTLYIEATKSHGKVKTTLSDRIYYVVDGKGEFDIDDEIVLVKKGDVVIVPKNTPYDYWARGILKLFLVHVPAFDPEYEVKLEGK